MNEAEVRLWHRKRSGGGCEHKVRRLLADHDARGVYVARVQGRHDGAVRSPVLTGLGGISPLGQRQRLPFAIDGSALSGLNGCTGE